MTIKIYVANLGKYNEGILQGEWFTLPADIEEIQEAIGINEEYEEYAIHDYEAPFKISEYDCIENLNELAEMLESVDSDIVKCIGELANNYTGGDIEEMIRKIDDIHIMHDCQTMEDVAYDYVENTGLLNDVPDTLKNYFDYEAFGRDMYYDGRYLYVDSLNCYVAYYG